MHAGATPMSIYNTLSRQPGRLRRRARRARASWCSRPPTTSPAGPRRWPTGAIRSVVVIDADAAPDGALTWDDLLERGPVEAATSTRPRSTGAGRRIDPDQPGDDPLHLRHHREPEGRGDHPPQRALRGREQHPHGRARRAENIGVSYLPYAHIAERVLGIYVPQVQGAHVHLIGDPAQLVGALGEVRPTRFFGVPRVWEKIQTGIGGLLAMETDEAKKKAVADAMAVGLEYVESLQVGHETSPELQAKFDAVNAAVLTPDEVDARPRPGHLGRQRLGADAARDRAVLRRPRLLDLRHLRHDRDHRLGHRLRPRPASGSAPSAAPSPASRSRIAEDGEILTRGPVNTSGYHQNPEATAELIDDDGWVHTGDIGEIDDDGFLKVVDRKKEMIITSSGKNIAPVQHREPPQGEPARRPRAGVRREQALRRRDPHPRPRRRPGRRRQARRRVRRPGRPRPEAGDPRRRRAGRRQGQRPALPARAGQEVEAAPGRVDRRVGRAHPDPEAQAPRRAQPTTPTPSTSSTPSHDRPTADGPARPRPRPRRGPVAQLR